MIGISVTRQAYSDVQCSTGDFTREPENGAVHAKKEQKGSKFVGFLSKCSGCLVVPCDFTSMVGSRVGFVVQRGVLGLGVLRVIFGDWCF